MAKQKRQQKQRKVSGSPHRKLRITCKWCPRPKHTHTHSGNTHRFHGVGSFCRTHKGRCVNGRAVLPPKSTRRKTKRTRR